MADLTITAANVKHISGPKGVGIAGAAITAGDAIYLDSADGKLKPCVVTALASSQCVGVALNDAAADQPVDYAAPGAVVDLGTGTAGTIYVTSASGGLAPHGDLASNDYTTVVTIGRASNRHLVVAAAGDVAVP